MKKILLLALLVGCGYGQDTVVEKPVPQQPPPGTGEDPGPGDGRISYAVMQGYLDQYCNSCHSTAAFMQSERALRSSATKQRVSNRTMPPSTAPLQMPDNVRLRMVNFF